MAKQPHNLSMKTAWAALILAATTAIAADFCDIVVSTRDLGLGVVANVNATMTPVGPLRRTYGTNLITLSAKTLVTSSGGVATFTNTLWGVYDLEVRGTAPTRWRLSLGTNQSGTVSAATLVTNPQTQPPNPATNYYTMPQVDALYVQSASGVATNVFLTKAGTNIVVETNGLVYTVSAAQPFNPQPANVNLTNWSQLGTNVLGTIGGTTGGITNNQTGVTLSGTFLGNGAGLTNIVLTTLATNLNCNGFSLTNADDIRATSATLMGSLTVTDIHAENGAVSAGMFFGPGAGLTDLNAGQLIRPDTSSNLISFADSTVWLNAGHLIITNADVGGPNALEFEYMSGTLTLHRSVSPAIRLDQVGFQGHPAMYADLSITGVGNSPWMRCSTNFLVAGELDIGVSSLKIRNAVTNTMFSEGGTNVLEFTTNSVTSLVPLYGDGAGVSNVHALTVEGTLSNSITGNAATATDLVGPNSMTNMALLNGTNTFTGTNTFVTIQKLTMGGNINGGGFALTNASGVSISGFLETQSGVIFGGSGTPSASLLGNAQDGIGEIEASGGNFHADWNLTVNTNLYVGGDAYITNGVLHLGGASMVISNSAASTTFTEGGTNVLEFTTNSVTSLVPLYGDGAGVSNVHALTVEGTLSNSITGNAATATDLTAPNSLTNMALLNGTNRFAGTNTFSSPVTVSNIVTIPISVSSATGTPGIILTNPVVATSGAPKASPVIEFNGNGFGTTGSTNGNVRFTIGVVPTSAATPNESLDFYSTIGGAAPVRAANLTAAGVLNLAGVVATGDVSAGLNSALYPGSRSGIYAPAIGTINFVDGVALNTWNYLTFGPGYSAALSYWNTNWPAFRFQGTNASSAGNPLLTIQGGTNSGKSVDVVVTGSLTATNGLYAGTNAANYITDAATVISSPMTVRRPVLTTSSTSNSPSATELATAGWVRGLFDGSGVSYYVSTNIAVGFTNADYAGSSNFILVVSAPDYGTRAYTTPANGAYFGSVTTTNKFLQINSGIVVNSFLSVDAGGSEGPTVKPEIYISYDGTNWFGDWSGNPQTILRGSTNSYAWVMPNPTYSTTNATGFYVQRRYKMVTQSTPSSTITVHFGTGFESHIALAGASSSSGNAFLSADQTFTGINTFTMLQGNGAGLSNVPVSGTFSFATQTAHSEATNFVADFAEQKMRSITLDDDCRFIHATNQVAGSFGKWKIYTGGVTRNLSFPTNWGWISISGFTVDGTYYGVGVPSDVSWARLELESDGTDATNITARLYFRGN